MTRRRLLRGALRALRYALVALVAALGVTLLAVALLLGTAPGRAWLLERALVAARGALPGTLRAERLERANPYGVTLAGVSLRDPTQLEVLRIERIEVELEPWPLARGRIIVPRVAIASGFVDLRDIARQDRGLLAALVDPAAPPSPPSDAPPPYVRVDAISVRDIDVKAPELPRLGAVNVRGLSVDASFELDGTPRATLASLSAVLEREGTELGRVERLSGLLGRGSEPSQIALGAVVVGSPIELSARAVLPPAPGWREAPLEARFAARSLSARALSDLLRDAALDSAFAGDAGVEITASGSVNELAMNATLTSAAGPIALDARVHDLERAELSLRAQHLEPSRVRAELPPNVVAFTLHAKADAADRARIPFSVQIPSASVDGEALPALTLDARYEQAALRAIDLGLVQGDSHLRVRGEASLAGAGALDVQARLSAPTLTRLGRLVPARPAFGGPITTELHVERSLDERAKLTGELSASSIAVADLTLEHVHASFDLAAPLIGGELGVELRGLTLSGERISDAKLALHGSGRQYRLNAEAAHAEAQAALALELELSEDEVTLHGSARGQARGQPFELDIAPTRASSKSVVTRGLALRVADQELELRGSLSRTKSDLELESGAIDLAALAKLAALPEPLTGTARLRGSVSGSLAAPRVALELESSGVSLGQRPPLDARITASLDAAAGLAGLELAAESHGAASEKALSLALSTQHQFEGGARWLSAIEHGAANARIELERLDLAFVEAWLGTPLGVTGSAALNAEAQGTLAQPELDVRSRLTLTPAGQPRSITLEPHLSYAAGHIELELPVNDAQGLWLDAKATLDFGSDRAPRELGRDVRAALARARWSFEATLAERELTSLPISSADLPPAAFSASARASGERESEPSAELSASVRQTQAYEGLPGCKATGTTTELLIQLQGGALRATLGASSGARRLFEAHAGAELALRALLEGGGVQLGRVDAGLSAKRLQLATLPLLCGRAIGTLDAEIALDDVLGDRPRLDGRIGATGLSLGTVSGLDLDAKLRADHEQLALDAKIGTRAGSSSVSARMPIEWTQGKLRVANDAPFELHASLDQLPIAPLLDPRGAISYATGSVSGEVHADGQIGAPRARGELRLNDIAFTATALAQPLRDIEGRIAFTERSLAIQGLRARDKEGELNLDGNVTFPEQGRVGAEIHVVAKRFPLRQEGQVVATTDVDATVAADITPEGTRARVTLKNVDTWIETASGISGLALDAHPEFVVDGVDPQAPKAQPEASKPPPAVPPQKTRAPAPDARVTELSLDASDRFWVKRDDFAVKLATQLEARIAGDQVRVTGKVDIDRGYLSLLGKIFTLERGSHLEFVGSEAPDPIVNISASHENRRAGTVIKVQITGRGSKPELTFLIDDRAASAGDAFLAIYGNQQSNQRPGEASDQARQFVGGLAAGLLATSARRELGAAAPIIMVEPGSQTGQGRVRAGLELDSLVPGLLQGLITGVYFEGIVARESDNPEQQQASVQGGALLELYFPKGFFSTGQYGPGATWSIDWGWQL